VNANRTTSPAGLDDARHPGPARLSAHMRLAGEPLPLLSPARLYVCGITPYDVTHLGHASTFVWADALRSVMRLADVETTTCRNVTDIDDVLTLAASRRGRYYDEFALSQEFLFDRDMRALGVRRPEHSPHARHHVTQVLQLAAALVASGHAYDRDGYVYFRGRAVVEHAGIAEEEARRLATEFGDDPDDARRDDPFDVPVWRPSSEGDPGWPGPWGWGRPGWHAECAAMAWAVFGAGLDVVVGGTDLTFPHHVYQAAMLEAATGVRPFARRHVHVGEVRKDGAKMAKSTGNLALVGELLQDHSAAAVRLMLLNRPWHATWEYSPAELVAASDVLEQLYAAAGRPHAATAASAGAVTAALLDDLDVPTAVELARDEGGPAARLLLEALNLR
jgi:L-cysteine:1D-myo-inositol 2-amino-2-deoxy-alpha-D-glucopyranoside ligase